MFWSYLLIVLAFALLFSLLLGAGLGWRHPARRDDAGGSLAFAFLILLLSIWAFGAWITPWGPVFYGVPWLSLLLVGLFVTLLILAISAPSRRPRRPATAVTPEREEEAAAAVFGTFFWLLLLGLLIAIVVKYIP